MRLGLRERGVTELMAAADHARGLSRLAFGLRVAPDCSGDARRTEPSEPVESDPGGAQSVDVFKEIRAWAVDEFGADRIPALWQGLLAHPVYLEAVWRREQAVMAGGDLTKVQKRVIGYAVAVNSGSVYMLDWYAAALRRLGLDERAFVEILAVVDYFSNLNTLAVGMDLQPEAAQQPDATAPTRPDPVASAGDATQVRAF